MTEQVSMLGKMYGEGPPKLHLSELPDWSEVHNLAIDIETKDPHLKTLGPGMHMTGSHVIGVSFAFKLQGRYHGFYVPFRHEAGEAGNYDQDRALHYLRDNAKRFQGSIIGANLNYDLGFLLSEGVKFENTKHFRDIQIAEAIINERKDSYSLDDTAKDYGFPGKDETALRETAALFQVDPKAEMYKLPPACVQAYAEKDAVLPLQIYERQRQILDKQDLMRIFNLESDLLPLLVDMRHRGVRIDIEALSDFEQDVRQWEMSLCKEIQDESGYTLEMDQCEKVENLIPILDHIDLPTFLTKSGQVQVSNDRLENHSHPIGPKLAKVRKYNKLRRTFCKNIRDRCVDDGRVHSTYFQIAGDYKGCRFGRMSSSYPNLQNQPSRGELAKRWRSIYLPEEGCEWVSLDYSQQEPRWMTQISQKMGLQGAAEIVNRYNNDESFDIYSYLTERLGRDRKKVKQVFLAQCYGQGGASLCDSLQLPTEWGAQNPAQGDWGWSYFETEEEARRHNSGRYCRSAGKEGRELIALVKKAVPYLPQYSKQTTRRAKLASTVRTMTGRTLHYPESDFAYKAVNHLIQASAADQMKTAMVHVGQQMPDLDMKIQVHDELCLSVPKGEVEDVEKVKKIMSTCMDTDIKFVVDVERGKNWGDSMVE